jgi:hypothetical protein
VLDGRVAELRSGSLMIEAPEEQMERIAAFIEAAMRRARAPISPAA